MKAKTIFVGIIAVSLLLSACAAMGNGTSPETAETSGSVPVLIPYETAGVVETPEGVEVVQLT
ncbi:MAG: hypothetical protein J1E40_11560, partial [Oscillospiraceae bacterium]|nr:hypothetical protein [Oscillospiraceae bacterium]